MTEPLIVSELRRENAVLRVELDRMRRQEAWVAAIAAERVRVLEDGLREIASQRRGQGWLIARILSTPLNWQARPRPALRRVR